MGTFVSSLSQCHAGYSELSFFAVFNGTGFHGKIPRIASTKLNGSYFEKETSECIPASFFQDTYMDSVFNHKHLTER